ncbi:hypothetical protein Ciccas_002186 [Cichlidogyrus casuarinus]|uniref:Beta-lactamase-related domain-containing protein n=1 Tax=Cichlidogyrus casuarinus TaxID=1844966 RepID=A0ABD2QI05_9PLAT
MVHRRLVFALAPLISLGSTFSHKIIDKNDNHKSSESPYVNDQKADNLVKRFKEYNGSPGVSVCVRKGNATVYKSAFGYSDVENLVPARVNTSYRIASISKLFTSILFGRHMEKYAIRLDDPIQNFTSDVNVKSLNYNKITARHILAHSSGIRHYKTETGSDSLDLAELLSSREFKNTQEALTLFLDDELLHEPGQKYTYSTHSFTLLAYALEQSMQVSLLESDKRHLSPDSMKFINQMKSLFQAFGLTHTDLDLNPCLIGNRTRYYRRDGKFYLTNCDSVNCSYKYAGGGLVSTVEDLTRFGQQLVNIYTGKTKHPYISQQTLATLWSPQDTPVEYQGGFPRYSLGLGCFLAT